MKIKKIVIPFITMVIMVSQLTGCARVTSGEMVEGMGETPEVSIEWAVTDPEYRKDIDDESNETDNKGEYVIDLSDPQASSTPASNTEDGTGASDTTGTNDTTGAEGAEGVVDTAGTQLTELTPEELEEYFQLAYDSCEFIEASSLEEKIAAELQTLQALCDSKKKQLPPDYEDKYRGWRSSAGNGETGGAGETGGSGGAGGAGETGGSGGAEDVTAQQLFTDCNEVVYAVGTVNIRASWTANSTKLGVLTNGQSITRTGKPIPGTEVGVWCRVQLSDGSIGYMHGDYLSTTQPVQTQTGSQGGSQASGTGGSGGSTTGGGGGSVLGDTIAEIDEWIAQGGGIKAGDPVNRPGAYREEGGWTIPGSGVNG